MIPPPEDAATPPPVERVGPHHSSDTVHRNENEQARAGQVDGVVDMSVQGQDPFNLSRVLQTLGLGGQRGWGFSDVDGCLAVALCFLWHTHRQVEQHVKSTRFVSVSLQLGSGEKSVPHKGPASLVRYPVA